MGIMKLFNNTGLLAFIFFVVFESATALPVSLVVGKVDLLKLYEAEVEDNYIYGEVKGIPYTAFASYKGKPLEENFYKYLVDNVMNIKLTIKYSPISARTKNVQPTIDISTGKTLFGFKFEMTLYPPTRAVLKIENKEYPGYFKQAESQLVFFDKVTKTTSDLEALKADLENNKNLSFMRNSSTTSVTIKKLDIYVREINPTEGSALYLTYSRQVFVHGAEHRFEKSAFLNPDNSLEFETSQFEKLLKGLVGTPWLKYFRGTRKYRVFPTTFTSTVPDENGNFTLVQKFKPSAVNKFFPHYVQGTTTPSVGRNPVKIVFSTSDPKSKSLAFLYKDEKKIQIYSNEPMGDVQEYIRQSVLGFCQDRSGSIQTVIPIEQFDIEIGEAGYYYHMFSYETTVNVSTSLETLIGKLVRKTKLELFASKETLQNLKSTANSTQTWTMTTPDKITKTINNLTIIAEPKPIKDMFSITVTFREL